MELLEKITLYDILGYTLPGSIMLYIMGGYDMDQTFSTFGIIVFIAIGYLIGIMISQIASFITAVIEKSKWVKANRWKAVGLSVEVISKALENTKMINPGEQITNEDEVWKHYINMYSDIQADKLYSRLHNYASAALLYKNMAIVSIVSALNFGIKHQECKMGLTIAAIVLFASRWYRFEKKKRCYTINWYVEKHVK